MKQELISQKYLEIDIFKSFLSNRWSKFQNGIFLKWKKKCQNLKNKQVMNRKWVWEVMREIGEKCKISLIFIYVGSVVIKNLN